MPKLGAGPTRLVADGIKVLMSGTGGDDVFTGYRRHRIAWLLDRFPVLARPLGLAARYGMLATSGSLRNRLAKLAYMTSAPREVVLRRMFEFNQPEDIAAISGPSLRDHARRSSQWLDDGLAETAGAPMVERAGERYYFCSRGCRDEFLAGQPAEAIADG